VPGRAFAHLHSAEHALLEEIRAAGHPACRREPLRHTSRPSVIVMGLVNLGAKAFCGQFLRRQARTTSGDLTLRATSNWSRPNGTTHTGIPRAKAF